MKYPSKAFLLACLTLFITLPTIAQNYEYGYIPTFSDGELQQRLRNLSSRVAPPKFTPAVKSYINTYTVKKREHTEAMLGRITMYFPMFEQYMQEQNVPLDLKYLSIVESALNPNAVSRSGAVGLWQFMPPTGKENGLKINSTVDERKDPHKSTVAAMQYLKKQYKRYDNWELALAAYNGGPGRVNRAIKRGRSKNFWRIKRYLPKETRNYVPAFIAATYIVNYYQEHNLNPKYPAEELQNTGLIKVYNRISFYEIEQATGVPIKVIERLNPSYKRRYIPSGRKGNNLVLPQYAMHSIASHLGRSNTEVKYVNSAPSPSRIPSPELLNEWSANKNKSIHTVFQGETYESIAAHWGVSPEDLKMWNQHKAFYIKPGLELDVYTPKLANRHRYENIRLLNFKRLKSVRSNSPTVLSAGNIKQTKKKEHIAKKSKSKMRRLRFMPTRFARDNRYDYHVIDKNETLYQIAERYENVSPSDILKLNQIDDNYALKAGQKIKIRKK